MCVLSNSNLHASVIVLIDNNKTLIATVINYLLSITSPSQSLPREIQTRLSLLTRFGFLVVEVEQINLIIKERSCAICSCLTFIYTL